VIALIMTAYVKPPTQQTKHVNTELLVI